MSRTEDGERLTPSKKTGRVQSDARMAVSKLGLKRKRRVWTAIVDSTTALRVHQHQSNLLSNHRMNAIINLHD